MSEPDAQTTYLTPNQVAKLLMVSPITVRQWAQKGLLPASTTAGGHRRFQQDVVMQFARERGIATPEIKRRVLVVDDDQQFNTYLVRLFESSAQDVEVASASDGFEAGRLVQALRPQVVVLDIMMPGMDGIAVCRSIKSDAATAHARVVGMTGHHSDLVEERMLDAGAEVLLRKPFTTEDLFRYCEVAPIS